MSVVGIYLYAKSREGVATPARPCASDGSPLRAGSLPCLDNDYESYYIGHRNRVRAHHVTKAGGLDSRVEGTGLPLEPRRVFGSYLSFRGVDCDIRAARRNREFQKRWRFEPIAVGPRGRADGVTVLKPSSFDDVRGCVTALRRRKLLNSLRDFSLESQGHDGFDRSVYERDEMSVYDSIVISRIKKSNHSSF
eukprot:6179202-Pleurochrysis_carterae.AAC.1